MTTVPGYAATSANEPPTKTTITRLGASHQYVAADPDTFKKLRNSFDLILTTVSTNLELGEY